SLTTNSFAPPLNYQTPAMLYTVAIGDLDGNQKPELVTSSYSSPVASILWNTTVPNQITGNSFAPVVNVATPSQLRAATIVDIDGDGWPDLAVSKKVDYKIALLRNQGVSSRLIGNLGTIGAGGSATVTLGVTIS